MSTNHYNKQPRIGDIFYVEFSGEGSVQTGKRPAIVFQNNVGNLYSPNVTVFPVMSRIKKGSQPTHVVLRAKETGLAKDSMVLCENPVCIPKERLGCYVSTLESRHLSMIAEASILASCAIAYIDPNSLQSIWNRASQINAA